VDNLERLLQKYIESDQTKAIVTGLDSEKPARLLLTGMVGAQECFVLSSIFTSSPKSHVFIANDKEEAAYIQNTLDQITTKQSIFFFPDSFRRPALFEEVDNNNVLIRTESINKIAAQYHKNDGYHHRVLDRIWF